MEVVTGNLTFNLISSYQKNPGFGKVDTGNGQKVPVGFGSAHHPRDGIAEGLFSKD